jgi:hypothetical protein
MKKQASNKKTLNPRTSAERQAAWRERVRAGLSGIAAGAGDPDGARRIDLFLPARSALSLIRLAQYGAETQAEVLVRLIDKQEQKVLKGMTEAEAKAYHNVDAGKPGPKGGKNRVAAGAGRVQTDGKTVRRSAKNNWKKA